MSLLFFPTKRLTNDCPNTLLGTAAVAKPVSLPGHFVLVASLGTKYTRTIQSYFSSTFVKPDAGRPM